MPLKRLAGINQRVLNEATDPDFTFRYIDISAVHSDGSVGHLSEIRFAEAPSRARRIVKAPDVIISTVRTYLRAIARVPAADDDLVCSTGFAVLTARTAIDPGFLYWWARSIPFVEEVVARSVGVGYPAIPPDELGRMPTPVPPIEEQKTIARSLDHETAHIDEVVAYKKRLFSLLAERMRGLSAGEGKLSQLDFSKHGLPLCPDDYEIVQLGRVARIQSGITLDSGRPATAEDVTVPYLRVANVQGGFLDLADMKWVSVPTRMAKSARLEAGDVLMTEGGDPDKLGRGSVWQGQIPECIHQNYVFAIRPDPNRLLPEYLSFLTGTPYARAYYEVTASKTTGIASTSTRKIAAWLIPLPPLEEQRRVVEQLRKDGALINEAIEKVSRQLRVLAEHRQALITAAVTGQLDVSGNAA